MSKYRILDPITPETLTALLQERLDLQPEARRQAVIASFAQVAALEAVNGHLGRESLWLAMRHVSTPREGDTPAIAARRTTCKAVADALAWQPGELDAAIEATPLVYPHIGRDMGGFGPARLWFEAQIQAFAESTDPRQVAMAATATRELSELPV